MDQLTDLVVDRVALVPEGDDPLAHILLWKARGQEIGDEPEGWADVMKRTFTQEQRVAAAKAGNAIPVRNDDGEIVDGRYPIENVADLLNAARAIGRVAEGDRALVIRHIKKRARALGATDRLGDTFKGFEKAPRLAGRRLDSLRSAYLALGEVIDEVDRKEERMGDPEKKSLPDDLDDEVRKQVDEYVAAIEGERDEATKALEDAKAELEKLQAEPTPSADEPTDPVEKALADPDVPDSVKTVLRSEKERRETTDKERDEALAELQKEREDRAVEKAIEQAREFKHLSIKAEEFGPLMRKIEQAVGPDDAAEIGRVLRAANAVANEAMREIGKGEAPSEAEDRLRSLAKEYAKQHDVSEEVALTRVVQTQEGRDLMQQRESEREEV